MGISFHVVVVFGLGKNLLFKSVLEPDEHYTHHWSQNKQIVQNFWVIENF